MQVTASPADRMPGLGAGASRTGSSRNMGPRGSRRRWRWPCQAGGAAEAERGAPAAASAQPVLCTPAQAMAAGRLPTLRVHAGKDQVNEAAKGGKGGGLYFPLTAVQVRSSFHPCKFHACRMRHPCA